MKKNEQSNYIYEGL